MMPLAWIGRRRLLGTAITSVAMARLRQAHADPAAVTPIRQLCDTLLRIMEAGSGTPFAKRFAIIAPVVDRVFDLTTILQVSVGPTWSGLPPSLQESLLAAFRRYTIANYVSNFDNYNGQRFEIQPDTKALPNGEQVCQTRIISASGESHELDYIMRPTGAGWRTVDVLADGSISRVAVQRSDFRRLLSRGGPPGLIESLNQKAADLSGGAALP
jgi:phospholipid transport system substrate-binding protein